MSWAGSIPVSLGPNLEGRLTRRHCLAILMAILYSVKNRADHDAQKKNGLAKITQRRQMFFFLLKAGQLDVDGTIGFVGILAERL